MTRPLLALSNVIIDRVRESDGREHPPCSGGAGLYAAVAMRMWWPDVALVACGQLAAAALEAADILETTDVSASVTEMSIVSQLREDELLRAVRGKRLVVTVEEHGVVGGLGSAVAEVLAERDDVPPLLALGTPRSYLDGGDVRQALLTHDGLDPWGIASRVLERLERSKKR